MVDILRAEGVGVDVPTFRRVELDARRVLHDSIHEGHRGTEPEIWARYFETLFAACGVPEEAFETVAERVRTEHAEAHLWTWASPDTNDVMRRLKADGYRVAVISNADGRMEGALERAGVRDELQFVIDSDRVGFEKPDPEIFLAGCSGFDLDPSACLYVGDLYPVDYLGARDAGLEALLLDPLALHRDRAATIPALAELPDWLTKHYGRPPR